ncbi:hypothetical protein [Sphingomonas bacterium]|uniref:hypothetical protein n=1 Tax=Sphingomonas bacterium TaxID=1895847 RepID=UPI00157635CD|nr:hypothetical protein [Sphingomonas bacterium]
MNAKGVAPRPILATSAQIDAEQTLLRLLRDPALQAVQSQLKAELARTPTGRTADGAARIDEAVAQLTNSLIFKHLASYRPAPAFLWGTDDTPRTWLGHTLGGVGMAGDNPDNIYRAATIDGRRRYEIIGQFDVRHRPAQFSIEIFGGEAGDPKMKDQNAKHADLGNQIAMLTDSDLVISPDGNFRVTLGGKADGPNHIAGTPGIETIAIRDSLSNWTQRPTRLTIRPLDGAPPAPYDPAELRRRVIAELPAHIRFWSAFGTTWVGGLQPNTIAGPIARDGGWGFLAGFRYKLAPGKALLITTTSGGARYTGIQVTDPWMIASDARKYQTSLNLSQAKPNADGSYTYVIAPTDPGVANWVDTAGLHDGYGILRWQGFPAGAAKGDLLRDFKVIDIADLDRIAGLPRVTPPERRAAIAARRTGYESRLH